LHQIDAHGFAFLRFDLKGRAQASTSGSPRGETPNCAQEKKMFDFARPGLSCDRRACHWRKLDFYFHAQQSGAQRFALCVGA